MQSSLSLFPERHTKSFGERPVIPPLAYSIRPLPLAWGQC